MGLLRFFFEKRSDFKKWFHFSPVFLVIEFTEVTLVVLLVTLARTGVFRLGALILRLGRFEIDERRR